MIQRFGVIVLAAGASEHRCKPKQLLPYLGKTLIEHAARTALASGAAEVVVVVGSDASAIREKLRNLPVKVVSNREWTEGIASSIRCGIGALGPEIVCAVIALCDQPRTTPGLLRELAQRHFQSGSPIVASSYDGMVGAPSAFGINVFPELLLLKGDHGARTLIRQSPVPIVAVDFSGGNVDIEEPKASQLTPPTRLTEAPYDTYRDPEEARGPPAVSRFFSFSA